MKFSVNKFAAALSTLSVLSVAAHAAPLSDSISLNAAHMDVGYQVVSNINGIECTSPLSANKCYHSRMTLKFSDELPKDGWSLYFSHLTPVVELNHPDFELRHVNGDLHQLSAKRSVKAGETYELNMLSAHWSVSALDIMPNQFFALDNGETFVIEATKDNIDPDTGVAYAAHAGAFVQQDQWRRSADDNSVLATAEAIFSENATRTSADLEAPDLPLVPRPLLVSKGEQTLSLDSGISAEDLSSLNSPVATSWLEAYSNSNDAALALSIIKQGSTSGLPAEGYQLHLTQDGIEISAASDEGVVYALATLAQILKADSLTHEVTINDAPRFSYRGFHLDISRNFRSKEFVLDLVDQMARHKLNKLHFHLADDEGWRLAIDGLPELTEVGAHRCMDKQEDTCTLPQLGSGPNKDNHANGFYTKEDYLEILAFADARGIEVIPSLDMPGHSRSAVKAMEARYRNLMAQGKPQEANEYLVSDFNDESVYSSVQYYGDNTLNPCMESTYAFVDKVLTTLIDYHQQANIPLQRYHIGADETAGAWGGSPICQDYIANNADLEKPEDLTGYFIERVAAMVIAKGVVPGGWSDGMSKVTKSKLADMQINVWEPLMWNAHEHAYEFAKHSGKTILSFPDVLYFDFPYAVSPVEPGYYWATRATDAYKISQFTPNTPEMVSNFWVDRMGNSWTPTSEHHASPLTPFEGIQGQFWSESIRYDSVAEYSTLR